MLFELTVSGERVLRPVWGRRAVSLSLPVNLALLFLGLQCLFLSYVIVVYTPLSYEPPTAFGLLEIWWSSAEHGAGIPAKLATVNVLIVAYLWVFNRGQPEQWWARTHRFMLVGTAGLYLGVQYALLRLLRVQFIEYSVEVIQLGP